MEEKITISVTDFCQHHQIEVSFIRSLQEYGLLYVETENNEERLPQEQLEQVEKLVRLHYDLHINLEGLDAIYHLLQRIEGLQHEVVLLRHRLQFYEGQ